MGKERDNQRRSVFGRLAGYEDVNDAERLSRDPAMRAIVEPKGLDRRAASTSQMGRFETVWLATEENLAGLDQSLGSLDRPGSPERVTKFYQGRGTAEPWIKAGKNAINWTRQSCHSFRNNEVRLQLHALAYNLGNFLRTLALPREVEHWSLTTLRA